MLVPNLLFIVLLLCLLWAGLLLAKWALTQQSEQYWKLRQLSELDNRRQQIYEAGRALQQMDTEPEVLSLLFATLLQDIQRIQTLDPARTDLDRQLKEAEAGSRQQASHASGGSAAVATEQELVVAQRSGGSCGRQYGAGRGPLDRAQCPGDRLFCAGLIESGDEPAGRQ